MPTTDQKTWCLNQAIEIIKHAPADSYPAHERLKRVYKRLLTLVEDANESEATRAAKSAKKSKSAKA